MHRFFPLLPITDPELPGDSIRILELIRTSSPYDVIPLEVLSWARFKEISSLKEIIVNVYTYDKYKDLDYNLLHWSRIDHQDYIGEEESESEVEEEEDSNDHSDYEYWMSGNQVHLHWS